MFRALTCPSSGGKIVFTQHLVSSLSVNVCTVHWLSEDNNVTNILLMNKENCALKLVDEIILSVNSLDSAVCSQPVYCATVYIERRYQMLCAYNWSS